MTLFLHYGLTWIANEILQYWTNNEHIIRIEFNVIQGFDLWYWLSCQYVPKCANLYYKKNYNKKPNNNRQHKNLPSPAFSIGVWLMLFSVLMFSGRMIEGSRILFHSTVTCKQTCSNRARKRKRVKKTPWQRFNHLYTV